MSLVFVLDTHKKPLDPVHPGKARLLLTQGRAAVFRRYPFTIILKAAAPETEPAPLRLKIDPGSKTTGFALVNDASGAVIWAAELAHRGRTIRKRLGDRRAVRQSRRARKTRYRAPRFQHRRRMQGWLPPSLESRIANVTTWVARLCRLAPIAALSQEIAKFDTQALEHPDIAGIEYQQGALAGYEVREYLLEKWGRACSYCKKTDVPLQIEHLTPKSRGGSDRVSNLVLACEPCNQRKGTQTAAEFGFPELQAQAKLPLKDAAAVNTTRWALYHRLQASGLPLEVGTGGRTKWNRTQRGVPKTHWLDAACVGASTPEILRWRSIQPLHITATGYGNRQMCGLDKYGFPLRHRTRQKRFYGFETGDIVRAVIKSGKYAGVYEGRVVVRARPSFQVQGIDVHPKYLQKVWCKDGYAYEQSATLPPLA